MELIFLAASGLTSKATLGPAFLLVVGMTKDVNVSFLLRRQSFLFQIAGSFQGCQISVVKIHQLFYRNKTENTSF